MSHHTQILSHFSGEGGAGLLYLPDLTLWYDWHRERDTLSPEWHGASLPDIARSLGVPTWLPVRPWRIEMEGVEISVTEHQGERLVRSQTPSGDLLAKWILGPDGDWWQTEYPVKSKRDLQTALEAIRARTYILDPATLEKERAMIGKDGVLALEVPRRPLSDLLHEFIGWSEGLMLLGEPEVQEVLSCLEEKLQHLLREVADLPGKIIFSPDNLDGQFISPRMFKKHLADSYQQSAEVLHKEGKALVVHVGGPIRHLVSALAEAGIDGIEGISGPPQSDATLAEARALTGPNVTLWGGISQDLLVVAYEEERFSTAVEQAVREARGDGRIILGIADRVPVNADVDRLKALPGLIQRAG